jgi:hypothetical protein
MLSLLTFSGNRDCLAVAAYSADGHKINEFINAWRRRGLVDSQIFTVMDNSESIDVVNYIPPKKDAIWCTAGQRRVSQRGILAGKRIGQMKPAALLKIAQQLLGLAESGHFPELSANAVKMLRNLVKNLSAAPGVPGEPDPSI